MLQNRPYTKDPILNNNYKVPAIELGQIIKIRYQNNGMGRKKLITVKGNVIFANSRYITIKSENYKESFTLGQFKRGEIIII